MSFQKSSSEGRSCFIDATTLSAPLSQLRTILRQNLVITSLKADMSPPPSQGWKVGGRSGSSGGRMKLMGAGGLLPKPLHASFHVPQMSPPHTELLPPERKAGPLPTSLFFVLRPCPSPVSPAFVLHPWRTVCSDHVHRTSPAPWRTC